MDDGEGVTENDEKETEGSMVDVNTPVVEKVAEGVGVITDDEELPPPKSIKESIISDDMSFYKGHLP